MVTMPQTAVPLVDTHAHIFDPGLGTVEGARYVPDYAATLKDYLGILAQNGFGRGVLVQPSFLGSDNSYLLAALAAEPEKLRGVIVVDTNKVDAELSPERLAELHRSGVRGIRLNLIGQPLPELACTAWRSAGERLAVYGWHLEIQAEGQQWLELEPRLRTWPSQLVIDHLGLPRAEEPEAQQTVLQLAARENVWVKVSGAYRSPTGQAEHTLKKLQQLGHTDRLLFGSDWPSTRFENQTFTSTVNWAKKQLGPDLFRRSTTEHPGTLFGWPLRTPATKAQVA